MTECSGSDYSNLVVGKTVYSSLDRIQQPSLEAESTTHHGEKNKKVSFKRVM